MTKMLHLTTDQIVCVIQNELKRQFEEGDLSWYTEIDDRIAVDGKPDLQKIAEAIIKEGE